jgi:hypothetical protein
MLHPAIDSILDASTIKIIRASTRATCEILDPDSTLVRPLSLTPARELTLKQISEFTNLVLDPQSWSFARKRCLPRATALFRLQSDRGEVRVSVGMTCLDWIVIGPRGRWGSFFDPVQDQIRELLKTLYAEYASSTRRSMWRSGVIHQLRANRRDIADRG